MGLEVYFPGDILNALLAAEQASGAALRATSQENDEFAQGYQEGYRAALTTIALAFGLVRLEDHGGRRGWQHTSLPIDTRR